MSGSDNGIRHGTTGKKPIDHLRAFVSSVLAPERANGEPGERPEGDQNQRPFRGRNAKQGSGEDKTLKFLIVAAGVVAGLIFLILSLSQKHQIRPKQANPAIGLLPQKRPYNSGIVPRSSMQPTPESEKNGKLTAQDLENTVAQTGNAPEQTKPSPGSGAQTLGQIAPFNSGSSPADNWSPKPYNGQEQTEVQQEKAESAALAKPSLVFVANTNAPTASSAANAPLTPSLELGTGTRLWAHLASVVTTAVNVPVIAVIDYSYERDGEIVIPAGTEAVGHVQQADRSGYILIKFDRLEIPHGSVIPVEALATNLNLGPLKGKVSGTHTGRKFLARSFSDIGSGLALFAGQNNTSGAISEDDILRMELAQNAGNAGDQEIMQLAMSEHPIVTVPARTNIFVVFEKAENKTTGGARTSPRPTQQNLDQLRELLELQREMNQNQAGNGTANP